MWKINFYTILYSLHAVLQHAFTLTHPDRIKPLVAFLNFVILQKSFCQLTKYGPIIQGTITF